MTAPAAAAPTLVFVYGTLKRGGANHRYLAGQRFVASARTAAGFLLYGLDGYPGMVAGGAADDAVTGEIWEVSAECLRELDRFEGVDEGLFRRAAIPLAPPHAALAVQAYLYARPVAGRARFGATWPDSD